MSDLRERFGELDRLDAPDLWSDARQRRPRGTFPRGRTPRPLAAVLALAVAAAGFAVLVRTFSSAPPRRTPVAAEGGGSILFVRGHALTGATLDDEIYRMEADGSAVTKLTDAAAESLIASSPAWSPDGSRIAFVLSPPELAQSSSEAGIYVMNADGTGTTSITDGRYDAHPTWSPDGTQIAFTRGQGSSIMIVNVDGSNVQRIQLSAGAFPPYQWPAWSPDGTRIAFQASDAPHVDTNSVYVADIDGSNAARLTPGEADGYPAWSRDGSTIAYAGPDGVYLHNLASGSERRLTSCHPRDCGFDFAPAWSPDASQLIFSRQDRAGTSIQLFAVDADGSNVRQVTSGDLWSSEASWRPMAGVPTGTPSPTAENAVYLPPFLQGGQGWETRASGPLPAGDAGVAWASTTPLKDWPRPGQPAIPVDTISTMPRDAVIITVLTTPWALDPSLGPFPYGDANLDLAAAAQRGPEAEEPAGDYSVLEIDAPPSVLVRVYFGTSSPAPDVVAATQRELDTLELPPVCPSPTKGADGASMTATSGPAGASITISGDVPFQSKDGSYVRGPRTFVAWWNAAPKDWPTLASFSTATPSPAIPGSDVINVGQDDAQACEFSISFTVPDVPPGTYPIVVIHEGGGGVAMEASLSFTVT
jgi:Tol biopolymer transport system component